MNHVELLNEARGELRNVTENLAVIKIMAEDRISRVNLQTALNRVDSLKHELDEALSAVPVSKEEEETIQKAVDENDCKVEVVDDEENLDAETEYRMSILPEKIENAFRDIPAVQSPDGTIWYNYYHLVHLFIDMEDWADTIRDYMGIAPEESDKRNPGFYWVYYCDRWTIAEYNSEENKWFVVGSDDVYEEHEFLQIGEMIDHD